jgi:6-phosphogluconolactonase
VLNSSRNIVFLVMGKSKAETLNKVINGTYQPEKLPAQRIAPTDGNLFWLVDEEAGSLL